MCISDSKIFTSPEYGGKSGAKQVRNNDKKNLEMGTFRTYL